MNINLYLKLFLMMMVVRMLIFLTQNCLQLQYMIITNHKRVEGTVGLGSRLSGLRLKKMDQIKDNVTL